MCGHVLGALCWSSLPNAEAHGTAVWSSRTRGRTAPDSFLPCRCSSLLPPPRSSSMALSFLPVLFLQIRATQTQCTTSSLRLSWPLPSSKFLHLKACTAHVTYYGRQGLIAAVSWPVGLLWHQRDKGNTKQTPGSLATSHLCAGEQCCSSVCRALTHPRPSSAITNFSCACQTVVKKKKITIGQKKGKGSSRASSQMICGRTEGRPGGRAQLMETDRQTRLLTGQHSSQQSSLLL